MTSVGLSTYLGLGLLLAHGLMQSLLGDAKRILLGN
jgi:hypothetical protein